MKICSPQLGVSPISNLGGEVYDYQTLKGFTKKGIDVFIYLPKNRLYDKNLKHFYVTYAPITPIVPPWIYSFICLPYLFRTYKKEKFDVLRIHSPRFLGIAGIIFHFFFPKVPILSSAVTVDDSLLFYPIEKLLFRLSKRIIVQSQYLKGRLIKRFNLPEDKIAVTYGGSLEGTKKWSRIPRQASLVGKNDPLMLFMGSLIKRKNPLFVVDLFTKCKENITNLKLAIIGDGPLKNEMRRYLESKGILNDSIFIKEAYGQDKAYWFSRMDLFIFPSLDEGFGLVVTEAMSFGKPVITSDRAAFKEIITLGKNGYALPLSKINLWVNTVKDLIKNPSLSKKIGLKAKKTVNEKFNWERTYDLNAQVVELMVK